MCRFLETYAYQDWLIKNKLNRSIMAKKIEPVVMRLSCHKAQSISVPQLGIKVGPWQWKLRILTTRPSGKIPPLSFMNTFIFYERFLLCGYHEADIEYLVHIIVYIDTSLASSTYKNFYPPFYVFDVTAYIFLYCISIKKLL